MGAARDIPTEPVPTKTAFSDAGLIDTGATDAGLTDTALIDASPDGAGITDSGFTDCAVATAGSTGGIAAGSGTAAAIATESRSAVGIVVVSETVVGIVATRCSAARIELVRGLLHLRHVSLLLVERLPVPVGVHAELLGLSGLRAGFLLGCAGAMLLLTGYGVLALQRLLTLLGISPQLGGLGELPTIVVPRCQSDERDDDDQRDHPDDDPDDGIHV